MDRQRSFTLKPTRFLVFSFTISSSLLFLFIFSILVFHNTPPSIPNIYFNTSTSPKKLTAFVTNFTNNNNISSLSDNTLLRKLDDSSKVGLDLDLDSVGKRLLRNVSVAIFNSTIHHTNTVKILGVEKNLEKNLSQCDVAHGRWVYDESYPLYTTNSCPFIDEGFSCEANGRSDKDYMKWRWQPYGCDLPRFNALKMLEMIRGKRLVFVGDSMNRNQWESMLCLLIGAVKDPKRVYEARHRKITKEKGDYSFKFLDYQCTVEYYVTHYLVHESKGRVKQKRVPTLRIDTMDRGASRWKGADYLVFNTAHWWSHYKTKAGVNYYQEGNVVHPYLDSSTAFTKALITWASWVDRNIKPTKTQVFFRSSAPSHFRGGQWNTGGHCKDGIAPINDTSIDHYPEKNIIVEGVIKGMKTPITLLNITRLSGFRIDGHPSIYGKNPGKSSSSSGQDCSHWCLPGVPDTWNELLYFYMQSKERKPIFKV
ncbi:hypothetical protein ACHQM5_026283 [Ranunculus cassubicifolius]